MMWNADREKRTHRCLDAEGRAAWTRRASALVMVLAFGSLLSILAAGVLTATVHEHRLCNRSLQWAKALAAAEAGIEEGVHELSWTEEPWSDWFPGSSGEYWKDAKVRNHSNRIVGEYRVRVFDPLTTHPRVQSTGYIPSINKAVAKRTVQIEAFRAERSYFEWGIFSYSGMTFHQNFWADSYNSRVNNGKYPGRGQGNSNSNLGGGPGVDARFDQGGKVFGNVQVGGEVAGAGDVSGDVITGDAGSPPPGYPEDELAEAQLSNDNLQIKVFNWKGEVEVDGIVGTELTTGRDATVIMPPGTYYLTSVFLGQRSTIKVVPEGEVVIYLNPPTDADMGFRLSQDNFINAQGNTENPRNFKIFQTRGEIDLAQNLTFYGAIFAPNSPIVQAQNPKFFGAIVVSGVLMSQFDGTEMSGFHYDESLAEPIYAETVLVRSWVEMPPQ